MSINGDHYISDKHLLSKLLRIPLKNLKGKSIEDMINNLINDPYETLSTSKTERIMMVREISQRYGKTKLQKGEPFSNSAQIYKHFHHRLKEAKRESFFTVLLDNKYRVVREETTSVGILNKCLVHPREVFAPAIEVRAAAIIIIHNHPSGDPQPSKADLEITKRLKQVGEIVGISVLDHIIIGADGYYSFVDENTMP